MKRITLLIAVVFWAGCNGANVSSGKTLAEVNGTKITEGHLEFLSEMNPGIARQMATPFGQKQILDNLIEQELLFQAAKREGIHRDSATQAKIDLYKKVILAQAYVESEAEKEARKHYDANPAEFERLKLSHIQIRYASPDEIKKAKKKEPHHRSEQAALKLANEVYEKLKKGETFEAMAKQYSEDVLSKERAGELGEVSKNDVRLTRRGFAPLLEKAFGMKVGELAGPVKTAGGYHLLTVTAPAQVVPFEAAKQQLVFRKVRELRNQLLAALKEKGKVTYAEELVPKNPSTSLGTGSERKTKDDAAEGGITGAPAETPPHPPHEGHDDHSNPPQPPAQNGKGSGE